MPRLIIEQQHARLGLDIQKPRIQMHRVPPLLEMTTDKARLEIESPRARLNIDQSQCFAMVNRRNIIDFSLYYRDRGQQKTLEAIAHLAKAGDSLGAIETGVDIIDIVEQESTPEMVELVLESMPGPHIKFEIFPVMIDFIPGKLNIKSTPGRLETQFDRGWVKAYLIQKNWISFKVAEGDHDIIA